MFILMSKIDIIRFRSVYYWCCDNRWWFNDCCRFSKRFWYTSTYWTRMLFKSIIRSSKRRRRRRRRNNCWCMWFKILIDKCWWMLRWNWNYVLRFLSGFRCKWKKNTNRSFYWLRCCCCYCCWNCSKRKYKR